jgi:riboflavin synthase
MFTGIIDHCGTIQRVEHNDTMLYMWVKTQFSDLQLGESIAVDGICLTVTESDADVFACSLSPETLKLTTAKHFKIGQQVNLERALRVNDRLGGHIVQGHVDQTGTVARIEQHQECYMLEVALSSEHAQAYIISKGSIAVNGVSLTINHVLTQAFQVMLIPHTLALTNLKHLQPGDQVNIEFDWLTKIVRHQIASIRAIE